MQASLLAKFITVRLRTTKLPAVIHTCMVEQTMLFGVSFVLKSQTHLPLVSLDSFSSSRSDFVN